MSFVLVVHMTVREGAEDEAMATMRELAEETRKEPGCELYIPCRGRENPRAFIIYEQYVDEAALDAHRSSEHFERLATGKLFDLLESQERTFYDTV